MLLPPEAEQTVTHSGAKALEPELLIDTLLRDYRHVPNKAEAARASFDAFLKSFQGMGLIFDLEGRKFYVRLAPGVWAIQSFNDMRGENLFPLPEELSQATEERYIAMLKTSAEDESHRSDEIDGEHLHVSVFRALIKRTASNT